MDFIIRNKITGFYSLRDWDGSINKKNKPEFIYHWGVKRSGNMVLNNTIDLKQKAIVWYM